MFNFIVRHGILVTVTTLIICVLGLLAALRIPVQMIPNLEVRTITVYTRWPGATPQDIEKEILIEQEEYLRNIPYLEELTSSASMGSAQIELEFPFGVDITETLIRVNNALTQVPSYPENVDEPQISATSFSSNSFMYFYVSPLPGNPRHIDMDMMRDFVEDNVRTRMSSVAGVAQVEIRGGAERQIQILLDPQKLAAHKLSISDVRNAINARNRDFSGGEVESGKRRYLLRTIGRFKTVDEVNNLILAREQDQLVRLGDIAQVQLDHSKINERAAVNGQPVIIMSVRRESGSNVIDIKKAMMAEVASINSEVLEPNGLKLERIADDVVYVQDSIFNVWKNLAIGALLATIIMYLFMRSAKTTLIGVLGIPICTIAAFLGLLIADRTINVISLAGIAFAIGMTLDNSIVVLESIELERRKGLNKIKAAVIGVQKVWPAVLASTLTTVMVFLPVVFIEEEAGQLYSDVAIAISASIFVSMLVSITLIPTASARLRIEGATSDDEKPWAKSVLKAVGWILQTPKRRYGCILVSLLSCCAIVLLLLPPAEYLPEGEEAKTFAAMNAPPGYNLATMSGIADEIEAYFLPFVDDDESEFARGETSVPAIKYLNLGVTPQRVRIISETKNPAHIRDLMDALTEKYNSYPGMRAFAARGSIISSNDGGTRSVSLDISGSELADLYKVAQAAYQRATEVLENPRIQTQPSSLALAQPLVQIQPNWERAAEVGINATDIGFAVAALTDGAYVNEFFLGDDKIDMYLYNVFGAQASMSALQKLLLYTPQGEALPLSELAHINEIVDTSTVRRIDSKRTVTLNIIPPRSTPLETGVEIVKRDVVQYLKDSGQIPFGVNLSISGAADQLDATRESLSKNYLVSLVIIFLIMVAILNHWGFPLLIMITIPVGIAGGIAGLAIMNGLGYIGGLLGFSGVHQPFDMISMLGFLVLMGTVVNNPILIVHRAMENTFTEGMQPLEAVKEAVQSRLRPITISTVTTICGLAPLVLLPGAGSELYRGVGAIVLGGIVGAVIVTLTLLPTLTVMALQWQLNLNAKKS